MILKNKKTYNLQLKQIQSTVFSLPFHSTLGDKNKFVPDCFCRGFCIVSTFTQVVYNATISMYTHLSIIIFNKN